MLIDQYFISIHGYIERGCVWCSVSKDTIAFVLFITRILFIVWFANKFSDTHTHTHSVSDWFLNEIKNWLDQTVKIYTWQTRFVLALRVWPPLPHPTTLNSPNSMDFPRQTVYNARAHCHRIEMKRKCKLWIIAVWSVEIIECCLLFFLFLRLLCLCRRINHEMTSHQLV